MKEHSDRGDYLRIFINLLTDKSLMVGASSSVLGKALHATLFGILAQVFKTNLIDPID